MKGVLPPGWPVVCPLATLAGPFSSLGFSTGRCWVSLIFWPFQAFQYSSIPTTTTHSIFIRIHSKWNSDQLVLFNHLCFPQHVVHVLWLSYYTSPLPALSLDPFCLIYLSCNNLFTSLHVLSSPLPVHTVVALFFFLLLEIPVHPIIISSFLGCTGLSH